jgi:methionyl-tRNA synthetase
LKQAKRYTITAALPYANGPLHIGHIAGVYLPADIYARYLRSVEKDIVFICGSDEHGAAITIKAKKEGISPQEVVDKYHKINTKAFTDFGISFDIFHRTSSSLHHKTAQDFFLRLYKNNSFEEQITEQYYDQENKQFLADRYITGTCPKCANPNAYGDQCEKCGSTLSPRDLINPKSALSGNAPVLKETKHWFLPMAKHENWLNEWLVNGKLDGLQLHNPEEWKKQVVGQCKSWLDGGLQSRAMTRDLDWGVKVPLEHAEGKVLYVWLDAPIGYISATKQWAAENHRNWEDYWKNNDTKLVHFLAKDNIVFHCIIFPIILKEHTGYILPENVPANEFLNLEGDKISTSRNWAVWLHEYIEEFPNKQDELRYVLNAIAPEFRDSEFTWADYQARINNELVAILGNFVNRALVLTQKYYNGLVPEAKIIDAMSQQVLDQISYFPDAIANFIEAYRFRDAQAEVMNLARLGNKFLTDTEPWKLFNTDKEKTATVLNICLQICANLSILVEPILPFTSAKLRDMLNLENFNWKSAGKTNLVITGHQLKTPYLLFDRIEDTMVNLQVEKLKQSKENNLATKPVAPIKKDITFEEFSNVDIRIAEITSAERIAKTDKLLKLTISTGIDSRTIVSGIAGSYKPEEIIGKKVSVLLNLQPRKIKGIVSQGMILMAENDNGELSFLLPEKDMNVGNEIK